MGAWREGLAKERAVLVAATLTGLAEGALWALPVRAVAREATNAGGGPMIPWPGFVAWFTAAVLIATAVRHARLLPAFAAATGIGLGAWQAFAGSPDAVGVVVMEVVGIALLLRVVMLATRDWHQPATSFGWGSAVLLIEIVVSEQAGWAGSVPTVSILFFLASLASRGVTAGIAAREGAGVASAAGPRRWASAVVIGLGVVATGMAVAVGVGARGGLLQGMGRAVVPIGALVLVLGVFALTEKAMPVALAERSGRWVATLPFIAIGVAVAWLISHRQHRQTVFHIFTGIPLHQHAQSTSTWERMLGLVLFALIAYLLLRAFRARWAEPERRRRPSASDERARVRAVGRLGPVVRARRARREPPEDVVRRWYAETLDLLEDKNLPRAPARTPSEFAGDVAVAMPECAGGMRALTRAYESVRYGSRPVDRGNLGTLDSQRRLLVERIAQQEPLHREEER